ncbi:hypothetical protein [Ferrimonas pelagia]|uniref:Uncharacterized protein n=1 Tax=Ferrimonas pelagia TaxID=1177826 RepID=A0ABP9EZ57_9GAMM
MKASTIATALLLSSLSLPSQAMAWVLHQEHIEGPYSDWWHAQLLTEQGSDVKLQLSRLGKNGNFETQLTLDCTGSNTQISQGLLHEEQQLSAEESAKLVPSIVLDKARQEYCNAS